MDPDAPFPLTRRYLGKRAPRADSAKEFVDAVCAEHARGDIPSRTVRDLVHYEEALLALRPTAPGPPPRDDERVIISPHARVLVYGGALPEIVAALREDRPASPRAARGWIVMWQDPTGRVHERLLAGMEGWLLESFREPTPPSEAIEDDEDRALFAQMWDVGVLRRA